MNNAKLIQARLMEMCTHILFDYNKEHCGIDPLSKNEIDMWYGSKYYTAESIHDAMIYPLFDGKSITEIAEKVENLEL